MPVRDIFKISRKTFFNPAGWIDYESLKAQNQTIYGALRRLYSKESAERVETFDEAKVRLGVTDEDLQASATTYRMYALIFLILGLVVFAYSFYLLFEHKAVSGFILSLAVSGLFFATAFRYDFWVFQIRHQKLGATFAEWRRNLLGDKGTST